jgi:hypothetical protein
MRAAVGRTRVNVLARQSQIDHSTASVASAALPRSESARVAAVVAHCADLQSEARVAAVHASALCVRICAAFSHTHLRRRARMPAAAVRARHCAGTPRLSPEAGLASACAFSALVLPPAGGRARTATSSAAQRASRARTRILGRVPSLFLFRRAPCASQPPTAGGVRLGSAAQRAPAERKREHRAARVRTGASAAAPRCRGCAPRGGRRDLLARAPPAQHARAVATLAPRLAPVARAPRRPHAARAQSRCSAILATRFMYSLYSHFS